MSKAVKSVTGALGFGSSSSQVTAANINTRQFQIEDEAKRQRERIDPILQDQLRQRAATEQAFRQANIAESLAATASGRGPSLAQAQLKAAQDRSLSQLMAAQAAARGGSSSANFRTLAQAQTQGNRQVAQDAAAARIQEQRQAQDALSGLRQQEQAGALDLINTQFLADVAAKRELQQADLAQFNANQQAASQANQARIDRNAQTRGQIYQGASMAVMSDESKKKDVKSKDKDIDMFLKALSAKSFKYKEPGKPGQSEGKKYGIMAQDAEKSEVGRSFVKNTPNGKMLDMESGFSAILASQARLAERLEQIEKKKKGKA